MSEKVIDEKPVEIVVRRGAMRRFDALKTKTSELPVEVTWDRRTSDRRREPDPAADAGSERRVKDRRQTAPFTWELADFVVVQAAGHPKEREGTS